ncbi:MAG: pyruvate kinase [Candidatus Thermoplasmatota archaeon]|nr:pyruvate kinase [Candidatus Thermoplasmatota archaeon]
MDPVRKTKIVCTIGPVTQDGEMLGKLMDAGMDMARLNFSHGDHVRHRRVFGLLRELADEKGRDISILCDIQGPKIRTGAMKEPFLLNPGDTVRVTTEEVSGTLDRFTVRYPGLLDDLKLGDEIFINDGIVKLRVTAKEEQDLVCLVRSGGLVSDSKGCNIMGAGLKVRVPTEKDRKDLDLIAELDPEFVAVSFVSDSNDVKEVKQHLEMAGNDRVKVIAKIERPVALRNLDGVIEVSDGIMVARGDLGVEIPPHEVPVWQKEICRKCNRAGIPVIVATQMLDSMTEHSRPTRAEASDVFNSVLDGTDAVMLSNETSVGKHPVGSVEFMKDILLSAEQHLPTRDPDYYDSDLRSKVETVGHACSNMVNEFNDRGYPGKVLAITDTGQSARMVSKYRPSRDIIAITPERRTAREMNLVWGVTPVHSNRIDNTSLETRIMSSIADVKGRGLLSRGDQVIVVSSSLMIGDEGLVVGMYDVDSVMDHRIGRNLSE